MSEDAPVAHPVRFSAFRNRNFALLWSGLLISNVGTLMQNFVCAWLIFRYTHSPLWLGYLGLSFALPMCVLPLFSGTIVDRVHRIRLLYFTQASSLLIAAALAALYWTRTLTPAAILIATFLGATLLAFDNPARQALIPQLVSREELLSAVSLNSAMHNTAGLLGAALGGVLLRPLGAGWLFAANAASYVAVIGSLALMRAVPTHSGHEHKSVWESIKIGLAFAWRSRLVRTLLLLSAVTSVFGRSYQNLLPVFAHLWHGSSLEYGLLLTASAWGALAGAFGLASLHQLKHRRAILLVSGLLFAVSVVAFAFSPSIWPGLALQVVAGLTATVFGTIAGTFIQMETPDALRGRVMSFYSITLIGLPSLGVLGAGALAQWMGGDTAVPRTAALGAVVVATVIALVAPTIMHPHPGHAELPRD